jgi:hypothetical protein
LTQPENIIRSSGREVFAADIAAEYIGHSAAKYRGCVTGNSEAPFEFLDSTGYGAANRYCLTAIEHIRYTGHIHMKLKDVPDGEAVQIGTEE